MQIKVEVTGLTPLLMNRFTGGSEIAITSGHSGSSAAKEKGTPREQAESSAYRDAETGELYIPGPNMFAAIIDAGKFHKAGRSKVTTQKSSLVPAGLQIEELVLPLDTTEFEVDSRRVVIPATGGAIMRHRARLDEWKCSFTLDIDPEIFNKSLVRALVDDAGKKVGVGDYRPSRRGPFGKFVVSKWEDL